MGGKGWWEWTGERTGWAEGLVRSRVGEAQGPCFGSCLGRCSWGRELERDTLDPATMGACLYRAGAGTVRGEITNNGGMGCVARSCCWAWSDWMARRSRCRK
jgi:hypothetical protein